MKKRRIIAGIGGLVISASAFSSVTGADKKFEVYGHAQADYIQDFKRVDPNWESTLRPTKIPTQDGQFGSDGQAIISVKQTKFGRTAC